MTRFDASRARPKLPEICRSLLELGGHWVSRDLERSRDGLMPSDARSRKPGRQVIAHRGTCMRHSLFCSVSMLATKNAEQGKSWNVPRISNYLVPNET